MSWNGKVSGRESSKEAAAVTEREYQMQQWGWQEADKPDIGLKGVRVELHR